MRKIDLKKHIIFLAATVLTFLFCSCSSKEENDTYFIHALGFDKENGEYILISVCEKQEKDQKEYFTIKQSGKSIAEALDKTRDEYKDCYFATAGFYFISSECDEALINEAAKEICDSNILPSKSDIYLISGQSVEAFMNQIKSRDDTKSIRKEAGGNSVNAVSFFAKYTSGIGFNATTLSFDKEGKISSKEINISPNGKETKNEHIKR